MHYSGLPFRRTLSVRGLKGPRPQSTERATRLGVPTWLTGMCDDGVQSPPRTRLRLQSCFMRVVRRAEDEGCEQGRLAFFTSGFQVVIVGKQHTPGLGAVSICGQREAEADADPASTWSCQSAMGLGGGPQTRLKVRAPPRPRTDRTRSAAASITPCLSSLMIVSSKGSRIVKRCPSSSL